MFLVKAKNKKEAFNKFWNKMNYNNQEVKDGYVPHYKKDFVVNEIDEDFICLN